MAHVREVARASGNAFEVRWVSNGRHSQRSRGEQVCSGLDRQFDIGSLYKHYFLPASKKVGLSGLKWHSLRHTYASLMAGAGIDIYKVSRWMGHSNISVTDGVYTHLYATDHTSDMDKLEAFLATSRDAPSIGQARDSSSA